MSSPYVGEIRMFAGNFPPAGWAFCDGQQVAIGSSDNPPLAGSAHVYRVTASQNGQVFGGYSVVVLG